MGPPFALCNTVGGQDELVFDGASVVDRRRRRDAGASGPVRARAPALRSDVPARGWRRRRGGPGRRRCSPHRRRSHPRRRRSAARRAAADEEAEVYAALDARPTRLRREERLRAVVIALSGGIDSALVALIAVDALGRIGSACRHALPELERRDPVRRPDDRRQPRRRADRDLRSPGDGGLRGRPAPSFEGTEPGIAEENLQARIRGNLVMALSNKFGWLVLTTGNKSELSVGYATLYGDMAGGFAVIKDIFKRSSTAWCAERNEQTGRELVPASVLGARPRRSSARISSTRTPCLPTRCSTAILEAYVEGDREHRGARRRRASREDSSKVVAAGRPRRVQAAPGPARDPGLHTRRSAGTGACRSRTASARCARCRASRAPSPP